MGLADRDYVRTPPPPPVFGSARMWSFTTWLIVVNVAVFVLDGMTGAAGMRFDIELPPVDGVVRVVPFSLVNGLGHFSVFTALYHLQIWRFVTFQFLHASGMHLAMNMLGLFFFGPMIESYLGSRRYLAFYLICGIGGAVSYVILWSLNILTDYSVSPLVGASAGIYGILIAAAQVAPDTTVLIYGVLPMRLRMMAWILLGVAVYTVVTAGHNAGGEAAHLGGAIVGFGLISKPQLLNFFEFRAKPRMRYRP